MLRNFALAAVVVLVAGLAFAAYRYFRTLTPAEKLARLQEEVKPKGGTVFQTELQGKSVAFLLLNCEVFLLDPAPKKVVREKVLQPGFYLWFTVNDGQSIERDGEYVKVRLSRVAFGAGGGNAGGGVYRSKDGRNWEKHTVSGWRPVAEVQQ